MSLRTEYKVKNKNNTSFTTTHKSKKVTAKTIEGLDAELDKLDAPRPRTFKLDKPLSRW